MLTTRRRLARMKRSLAAAAARDGSLELGGSCSPCVEALAGGDARLDDLGELALLLGGEQGDEADLVEVLTDGITHRLSSNSMTPLRYFRLSRGSVQVGGVASVQPCPYPRPSGHACDVGHRGEEAASRAARGHLRPSPHRPPGRRRERRRGPGPRRGVAGAQRRPLAEAGSGGDTRRRPPGDGPGRGRRRAGGCGQRCRGPTVRPVVHHRHGAPSCGPRTPTATWS